MADAILGKGRETLERAIQMVNEGNYGGARVVYGDTDSMFVLVPGAFSSELSRSLAQNRSKMRIPGATKAEAFAIGRRIVADVTNANPTPVVLKLEKVGFFVLVNTSRRERLAAAQGMRID